MLLRGGETADRASRRKRRDRGGRERTQPHTDDTPTTTAAHGHTQNSSTWTRTHSDSNSNDTGNRTGANRGSDTSNASLLSPPPPSPAFKSRLSPSRGVQRGSTQRSSSALPTFAHILTRRDNTRLLVKASGLNHHCWLSSLAGLERAREGGEAPAPFTRNGQHADTRSIWRPRCHDHERRVGGLGASYS